jgi:hypothetical protein
MGNGVSSRESAALVQKWDRALDDLKGLTRDHQRLARQQSASSAGSDPHGNNAVSGTHNQQPASFPVAHPKHGHGHQHGGKGIPTWAATPSDDGEGSRMGKHGDLLISDAGSNISISHAAQSPTNAAKSKVAKSVALANKTNREDMWASYAMTREQRMEASSATASAANHFAAAAIALSSLLGGKRGDPRQDIVTVEDIFFAAEVPLTYLQQHSIELEDLHNIISTFIETDSRFRGQFGVEVAHLDVAPAVGHLTRGENRLIGEHTCKVTQPRLLERVKDDLASNRAVYLLQFDPYVLEQEIEQNNLLDGDENSFLQQSFSRLEQEDGVVQSDPLNMSMAKMVRTNHSRFATIAEVKKENDGMVGVVTGWRRIVLDTLRVAEAACFKGNVLASKESEFPFPAVYKAMGAVSRGCGRARGYIRIFRAGESVDATADPEDDPVVPFFSHELMTGTVIGALEGGTCHASAVEPVLAPHIVATAWAFHLLHGAATEGSHRHGRGLPISDLIRTLRLPCDVYLHDFDLPLDQVQLYISEYIRLKGYESEFNSELVPVITTSERTGAVPSLTQHELDAILFEVTEANDDPEFPSVAILFQYDPAIAHNALGITPRAQWGILAGYDRDRQLARLIDANAHAFGRSWSVSCEWLLESITNHGYIVVRHIGRLVRRQSMRGSVSLASSLRVGTAQGLVEQVEAMMGTGEPWTPSNITSVPPTALRKEGSGFTPRHSAQGAVATPPRWQRASGSGPCWRAAGADPHLPRRGTTSHVRAGKPDQRPAPARVVDELPHAASQPHRHPAHGQTQEAGPHRGRHPAPRLLRRALPPRHRRRQPRRVRKRAALPDFHVPDDPVGHHRPRRRPAPAGRGGSGG